MRYVRQLFLLMLSVCAGTVAAKTTPEQLWAELGQAGLVVYVKAPVPTPFLSGVHPGTGECQLLVNELMERPDGVPFVVDIAHEAGHCEAIKRGVHGPGELTRMAEGFADVYALAWISAHRPEFLQEAFMFLAQQRTHSRRISSAYDTLLMIKRAMQQLPTKDPLKFTMELMQ